MKRLLTYLLVIVGSLTMRAQVAADSIPPAGALSGLRADALPSGPGNAITGIARDSVPAEAPVVIPVEAPEIAPEGARVRPVPKLTPTDYDREKAPAPGMHYYDKHGNPLETPVRFLVELDTVTKVSSGPLYPAYNGLSAGFNFFDGIMYAFGQRRASFDLWAQCSLWNWLLPTVEVGLGTADANPDDGRFNFRVKPQPFVNVGFNYNFLYKSKPDYSFYIGLRAGWSTFSYDILSIRPGSDYYSEDGPTDIYGLKSTAFYGAALAGVKVKIWSFISMGWSFRYTFGLKQTYSDPAYPAWFTPGKNRGGIGATFSLIFDINRKGKSEKDSE